MKTLRYLLFVCALLLGVIGSNAQTTNFPDPSALYINAQAPFNSALTWTIGATAVLIVIGWIMLAMRRKR